MRNKARLGNRLLSRPVEDADTKGPLEVVGGDLLLLEPFLGEETMAGPTIEQGGTRVPLIRHTVV